MRYRYFSVFLAVLAFVDLSAQQRTLIDHELRAYLKTASPDEPIDLFLQGPTSEVARIARDHGAHVKMSLRDWTSVRMPAGRIHELDAEEALISIDFRLGRGRTLNDTMRVKTGIDRVQQGLAPLPQGYDGEDVLVGIIDTGLDFSHPDFSDSLTGTRVQHYWSHGFPASTNTPAAFGYGQEWDKTDIDNGDCPAADNNAGGHGTTVAGTAIGNGQATGLCIGAAPKSDIAVVQTVLSAPNWPATVADGVKYVFDKAEEMGKPAVVNLSLGDYLGSHDGLDPAALFIDSMLQAAPGRVVVCAAGNSGCFPNYTLRMDVDADTSFAWIKTNSVNSFFGVPAAYIDFWGDTASMNGIEYSIGADRVSGGYAYRGRIPFRNVQGTIDTFVEDTLYSVDGNRLAIVSTFASVRGGQYHLEIALIQPDSVGYYWRVMMTGEGRADAWCNNGFGQSEIVSGTSTPALPTAAEYPPMANYVYASLERGIVDSWACSPHVITVANYNNEMVYEACNNTTQTGTGIEGDIAFCSSYGATRTGHPKPDVSAPGDVTFTAAPMNLINSFQANGNIIKLYFDCMHMRAGGTSIASPAVAGTAALYLQKCPSADHLEVMQAINNAAFGDGLTGAVPNIRFGNGKLDAFAALVSSNYAVAITGESTYCAGDSALVQAPEGFLTYAWSDGSTGSSAWSQGEDLSVVVTDAAGCAAASDTLSFTALPAPSAPVITGSGPDLASTPADAYQWFLNGEAINGATSQSFTAEVNGTYTVLITAPNGCTALSAPVDVTSVGVVTTLSSELRYWPVPAHGVLYVEMPRGAMQPYEVIDAAGRTVLSGRLRGTGPVPMDISALAPGTYTLRIPLEDELVRGVFVVR